jgi:hypothetical protein
MESLKKIAYSMLEFLNEEYNDQSTSPERKESLEVASQCLETAFAINLQDTGYKSSKTLRAMFQEQEEGASVMMNSSPVGASGEGAGLMRGPYAFMVSLSSFPLREKILIFFLISRMDSTMKFRLKQRKGARSWQRK